MSLVRISTIVVAMVFLVFTQGTLGYDINEKWSVNFTERFRLVTWDNAIILDDESGASTAFTRNRTQLGTEWSPNATFTFVLQLGNEFRYYTAPSYIDFNLDEVFVDQMFLKLKRPLKQPLVLTVGRQNIMMGEGFVVMDGHPLDGSRSIYFNAIRLDWMPRIDHQLTAFMSRVEETDEWLPVFHDQDKKLVEQPESGAGLYYSGAWSGNSGHVYFIHKRRSANGTYPYTATTNTIGGRIDYHPGWNRHLGGTAELAYQIGESGNNKRRAIGGYAYLKYSPEWKRLSDILPKTVSAGVVYLSGDDPNTDDREDWEPMFARWPKWSESYIYTLILENGVAWWTNMISLNATFEFAFSEQVGLRVDYHRLTAPQGTDPEGGFPGGSGTTRGDLFIGKLSFRIAEHWSGHFLWEGFQPGDYYYEGADSFSWIRAELMFRY